MTTPATTTGISAAALFGQALGLFRLGQLDTVELLCRKIIELEPRHSDALHVLGVVALKKGSAESGAEFIRKSLEINPTQPHVHCSLGNALRDLRQPAEALASYRRALQLEPNFAGAHYSEGNALMDLGRTEEALESYERSLAMERNYPEANLNRGNALLALGRLEEALASYQRTLALQPDMTMALSNCASVLWKLQRREEALTLYDRLAALQPDDLDVQTDRGILLCALERYREAVASLDAALLRRPDAAEARFSRGNALLNLGLFERALADYDSLLERYPTLAEAQCNRGLSLLALARPADALPSFVTALRLKPEFVEAADGQGTALRQLNRPQEALAAFELARSLAPYSPDILYRCALTLQQLQRHEEAAAAFADVLRLAPQYDYAAGNLLHERLQVCDWSEYQHLVAGVNEAVLAGRRACLPDVLLSVADSAAAQLECARTYAADKHPANPPPTSIAAPRYNHKRICVAYVSGEFREHAVSHLLAGVLERHDRERFQTIAISLQPQEQSPMGQRLRAAFTQFIEVSMATDPEVVSLMRELEVDIAVDLMGLISGSRPTLFALRPAQLQVNFLGYPGTLGAPCYDYILADRYVIPEADRVFYQEKVAYLPHCFQPHDAARRMAERKPTRAECGLPQEGFVFCCFSSSYKIGPSLFEVWMRLLHDVAGSVLWLSPCSESAVRNLRRAAAERDIAPERLVFAARLPDVADHLARYPLVDLCLDTLPFNAQATASDTLWAGVPLVTCRGNAYAARVSASLLSAVGCPELITGDLGEYETLARKIATTPALARELRARLASARRTAPLFDTTRYCRDLESAYIGMWERRQRGETPQHFSVEAQAAVARSA